MRVEIVALPDGLVRVTVPLRILSDERSPAPPVCARLVRLYRCRGQQVVHVLPDGEEPARVGLHPDGPLLHLADDDLVGTLRKTLNLPPAPPGLTPYERYLIGLPSKE